ncbi:MAG: DNA cytosine methyltransferase [Dethiobacteraceae bacterium]
MKPQAADLFAGAGGITQALKNAGFGITMAVEINPVFAQSYRLNHCRAELGEKDYLIEKDIRKISYQQLEQFRNTLPGGELDLLAGCPPCQGFSKQMKYKRGSITDKRNYLTFSIMKFVKVLKPKYIFLENVPGFADSIIWQKIKKLLHTGPRGYPKYKIRYEIVDAASLGVPQRRRRFVLVCKRLDLCKNSNLEDITEIPFPQFRDKPVTLGEYFAKFDLPQPLPLDKAPTDELHKHSRLGEINLLRLKHTPEGKGRESWPEHDPETGKRLWLKCHDNSKIGYADVYGRMSFNSVAPTLTGGCLNISKGRFAHPVENRPITAREAALIQTFPIDYKFVGTWGEIGLQIGNAVPVKMGEAFFAAIMDDIRGMNS